MHDPHATTRTTPGSDATDDAVEALRDLTLAVEAFRAAFAQHFSVGIRETEAISYLRTRGPMSHRELATALRLTRGTVTALVDRLETNGLARRVPQRGDRRVVLVELADVPPLLRSSQHVLRTCLDQVPGATDAQTTRILRQLAEQLRLNMPRSESSS